MESVLSHSVAKVGGSTGMCDRSAAGVSGWGVLRVPRLALRTGFLVHNLPAMHAGHL